MTDENQSTQGPVDLARLTELIELMEAHGLTEVDVQNGEQRWKLRRGPQDVMQMVPNAAAYAAAPPPAPAGAPAEAAAVDDGTIEITSPTVGTFFTSPTPDDPPFVKIGSKVSGDTIVCIVEAMKVFNQIPAEVSGTITEVLVKNGDPVEFGQPLFRVRPG
ncbi:acetyl-CoA carboxylase biotin carboxyl carrier protein [Symmachiella dynata]|uniref:acetyl-CoA carboxylase biotin carboxyl carrier protein n=1 Tax=Symmachiella dynata TaxID=2527995 RepID=UPI001188DDEB|nr:acetyl-CoA carboxylase biotin carboxyl carrier protein [Symmachiella dynata]QDT49425.1 Acetyl-CoA biotin carboxyl carrier [Symmachiella dynata]